MIDQWNVKHYFLKQLNTESYERKILYNYVMPIVLNYFLNPFDSVMLLKRTFKHFCHGNFLLWPGQKLEAGFAGIIFSIQKCDVVNSRNLVQNKYRGSMFSGQESLTVQIEHLIGQGQI